MRRVILSGREGDLLAPDYHKVEIFRRAEAAGWDGVILNDWCQSRTYGNVEHLSWGVFPSAMHRIRWASVPCVRFDWAVGESCTRRVTPEFEAAWKQERQLSVTPALRGV